MPLRCSDRSISGAPTAPKSLSNRDSTYSSSSKIATHDGLFPEVTELSHTPDCFSITCVTIKEYRGHDLVPTGVKILY